MSTIKRPGPRPSTPARVAKSEPVAVPMPKPMPMRPAARKGLSDRFVAQKPRSRAVDEADEYGEVEEAAPPPEVDDAYAAQEAQPPAPAPDDGVEEDGKPSLVSRLGGAVVSGLGRLGGAILGEGADGVGSMSMAASAEEADAEPAAFSATSAPSAERLEAASDEGDEYAAAEGKTAPIPVPKPKPGYKPSAAAADVEGKTAPIPVPSRNLSKSAKAGDASASDPTAFSGQISFTFTANGQSQQVQATATNGQLTVEGNVVGTIVGQNADGSFQLEVLGKPTVGTEAAAPASSGPEFPSGRPETYIKTLFPPKDGVQASREEMVDTVLSVVPEAKREELRDLIEHGGKLADQKLEPGYDLLSCGVSDASLKKAFDAVLEARKSPGNKTVELNLEVERHSLGPDQGSYGESGGSMPRSEMVEAGQKVKLSVQLTVDASGQVNGAPLGVDQRTRLATELTKVGPDLKHQSLKEAGFSDDWLANTTPEQQDAALARLREATLTPGKHTLDFGFDTQYTTGGGESGDTQVVTQHHDGVLSLNVDDKGNVDGKPLTIETALATNRVFEQLSMDDKKSMLERFGFKPEDLAPLSPDRATDILARVAMAARTPGEHQLEIDNGPDKFAVGIKAGPNGEIEGVGVQKLAKPKKKSWFSKIIGPVLTIASIVFPPAAPFIQIAQAGLAIANGAHGLSLVGSVLGAAAGVADIGGFGSIATGLNTAANVVNTANGAINAIRSGDVLGAFSSVVSLAGTAGDLTGSDLVSGGLREAGHAAGLIHGAISAARGGDALGALSGLFGEAYGAYVKEHGPTPTTGDVGPPDGPGDPNTGRTTQGGPPAPTGPTDETEPTDPTGPTGPAQPTGPSEPTDTSGWYGPLTAPPVTVARGDTLSRIAQQSIGLDRLPELYEWNRAIIGDNPNLIQPGMQLQMPPDDYTLTTAERNAIYRSAALPERTVPDDGLDARDLRLRANSGQPDDNAVDVPGDFTGGGVDPVDAPVLQGTPSADEKKAAEELKELTKKYTEALKHSKDEGTIVLEAAKKAVEALEAGDSRLFKAIAAEHPEMLSALASVAGNPVTKATLGAMGRTLEGFSALVAGFEASNDPTLVSTAGRAVNTIVQGGLDVLVGRTSPAGAVFDATMGLTHNSEYQIGTNVGGVALNVIGFIEAAFVNPADRDRVLAALVAKNESGENGKFNQLAMALGRAVSSEVGGAAFNNQSGTPAEFFLRLGQEVAGDVTTYFQKQKDDAAARERLARRVRTIQQGG